MQCHHYDAGRCRSCTLIEVAYPTQVADKERHVRELLDPLTPHAEWLPPVTGPEGGFRNKAKMVVTGTVDAPVIGIVGRLGLDELDRRGELGVHGVDLTDCPLYPAALQQAFGPLRELVTRARLQPYDLTPSRGRVTPRDAATRGELKHLLVTISPAGELLVRLVLRSQEPVARLRKHLPWLQEALPNLAVLSVNLQPEHKAVLEGEHEIVLTDRQTLPMTLDVVPGGLTLHLRPQSFFQTNTQVAAALYRQAKEWVDDVAPASLWDLYCGVGGFALTCAAPGRAVTGIEISAEAVASAETTRGELAPDAMAGVRFAADDATAFALAADPADDPELVIVNPPRRGIGPALADRLEASSARWVLYSSCNAVTLAKDLARMPSLRAQRVRLLDMFPQTSHYEVLTLLARG
ncbi:MAG: 23S rRNA (uracil(747)-C(5))-methyltransferase RlmC [Promicromonosporaceae bacterium]|nr:23S rRNA (uracil(747)-C(5))-methyltransferase RlmC [Promicromonosporaceae bacterium]